MNRVAILEEASNCITGDRAITYGNAKDNFANIAEVWNWWIRMKYKIDINIRPADVPMMMSLLKHARLANGDLHSDGYIDAAGYIALAGEIALEK